MNQDEFVLSKRFQFSLDSPETDVTTDTALIELFVETQDHEAFTQLLQRHGPVVWGVCRRQHIHLSDAEDVFQATFLVLYQQARRIRKHTSLPSWLHGVAWRISRKLKRSTTRRKQRDRVLAQAEAQLDEPCSNGELNIVMEAELARLPAVYREPLLLCYLQGQSQSRAAQTLGWPIGTVAGRLSRAKELLRSRLVRRGVTPAVVASLGIEHACAHVPAVLLEKTLYTIQYGGGPSVALMAKGGFVNMWMSKWLVIGAVGICLTLGVGMGYSAWRRAAQQSEPMAKEANSAISTPQGKQDDHPDYQAIQGHWRCETRNEVTDTLLGVQDLTFRGRKFVKTSYRVEKDGLIVDPQESQALEFILDAKQAPKHIELQECDLAKTTFHATRGYGDDTLIERFLCNYDLQGDVLAIEYGGKVPIRRNDKGEIFADRNSPLARFTADGKGTMKFVYRRMPQEKNPIGSKPGSAVKPNAEEQAERERLLKERVKVSEMNYKLRMEAYRAGKETINFLLEGVKDRLESKLELAGNSMNETRSAIREALDDVLKIEKIAKTKYEQGSATLLEYSTIQYTRLGYELRLLK